MKSQSRRHHVLAALLTTLAVLGTSCGGGGDSGRETAAPPITSVTTTTTTITTATDTTPSTTATTSPTSTTTLIDQQPSQTPADALRDGVVPEVAALPMEVRVQIIAEASSDEGVWAITKLSPAADDLADGCRLGSPEGKYPEDFICTFEYGEVLLLDDTRSTILRAYPLPGVPAEHLTITDEAVFCGRNGVLPLPDSMICRIDRTTLTETVKVYQPDLDSVVVQPCFFPPGSWSIVEEPLEMHDLLATHDGVFAENASGTWTVLEPSTLLVVERDRPAPETDG